MVADFVFDFASTPFLLEPLFASGVLLLAKRLKLDSVFGILSSFSDSGVGVIAESYSVDFGLPPVS